HHLAECLSARADAAPAEDGAVLEDEERVAHLVSSPSRTVKSPRSIVWTTLPSNLRPANGGLRLRGSTEDGSAVDPAAGCRTASMVPSAIAARSAPTCSCERRGGATVKAGSNERTASSVSVRWCGVTSHVTRSPLAFARRIASTAPDVET